MTTLAVITAPVSRPVDLPEVKRYLRVDTANTADDADLERMIDQATAYIDGPQGWLGRALITQTLELRLDDFPGPDGVWLPCPPLRSVTSVKYDDSSNVEQTVSASVYRTVGGGVGSSRLILAAGQSWPVSSSGEPECVRIRYSAGYGTNDDSIPASIRAELLNHIAFLYDNRGSGQPYVAGDLSQYVIF